MTDDCALCDGMRGADCDCQELHEHQLSQTPDERAIEDRCIAMYVSEFSGVEYE